MNWIIRKINSIYNKNNNKMVSTKDRELVKFGSDYMLLSKFITCKRIISILDSNHIVICNLNDRNGKVGEMIYSVIIDVSNNKCSVVTNNNKYYLHDRYLYNIIYNENKGTYSLEEHEEYFEKIEIDK